MPIKQSAKKALRQSTKKSIQNFKAKKLIKDLIKKSQKLISSGEADKAAAQIKVAIKAIDKAIGKRIIKKNTGARKKSRLMIKLNKIKTK